MGEAAREYDTLLKVVLVGDPEVGRSAWFLHASGRDPFDLSSRTTIGLEFRTRILNIHNRTVKLQIWDAAGQERYRFMTTSYFHGSHAIVVVYDVTNRMSFDNLGKWADQITDHMYKHAYVETMLVGNNCHLPGRSVSWQEGAEFAESHGMLFAETLPDVGDVEEAITKLAHSVLQHRADTQHHENVFCAQLNVVGENGSSRVVCTSLAGEELATRRVDDPDRVSWDDITSSIAEEIFAKRPGAQPQFILPDGSIQSRIVPMLVQTRPPECFLFRLLRLGRR